MQSMISLRASGMDFRNLTRRFFSISWPTQHWSAILRQFLSCALSISLHQPLVNRTNTWCQCLMLSQSARMNKPQSLPHCTLVANQYTTTYQASIQTLKSSINYYKWQCQCCDTKELKYDAQTAYNEICQHACMHDVQLVILFNTAITMTIMLLDLAMSIYVCMHACLHAKLKL